MRKESWSQNTELEDNEKTHPLLDGLFCGDSWTRTNDPIDVNDVLYRLSHATESAPGLSLGTEEIIT